MQRISTFFSVAAAAALLGACQPADEPAPATAPAEAAAPSPAGTITIDGQTWNLIPDTQCSVFPGPVVSIAGHAAEDPAVEIVIDYSGAEGPTGVSVTKPDGTVDWNAYASMNFQIERKRVQGAGYFTGTMRGVQKQAEGRFDVDCR